MLCQFSFKNFKSYKETTTFDFQATSIPEFSESLLKSEKADALLPVGVIYGPNGGGKTNLLLALSCLISTVVKPIYELEKAREKIIIQQKISAAPFYFNEISVSYLMSGYYGLYHDQTIVYSKYKAEYINRKARE